MSYDIQFSKGSYSSDLHSDSVSEEFSNRLIVLKLPQSTTNQTSGKRDTKILDLLRITHQFIIKAYIAKNSTKSAKDQKDDLIAMANGAGTNGGVITMTFDGDSYEGYIEKIIATKESMDSPDTEADDEMKYILAITFVVGVEV